MCTFFPSLPLSHLLLWKETVRRSKEGWHSGWIQYNETFQKKVRQKKIGAVGYVILFLPSACPGTQSQREEAYTGDTCRFGMWNFSFSLAHLLFACGVLFCKVVWMFSQNCWMAYWSHNYSVTVLLTFCSFVLIYLQYYEVHDENIGECGEAQK